MHGQSAGTADYIITDSNGRIFAGTPRDTRLLSPRRGRLRGVLPAQPVVQKRVSRPPPDSPASAEASSSSHQTDSVQTRATRASRASASSQQTRAASEASQADQGHLWSPAQPPASPSPAAARPAEHLRPASALRPGCEDETRLRRLETNQL